MCVLEQPRVDNSSPGPFLARGPIESKWSNWIKAGPGPISINNGIYVYIHFEISNIKGEKSTKYINRNRYMLLHILRPISVCAKHKHSFAPMI
jgi:hypothetical protein